MKNYDERQKLFYVRAGQFPDWNYGASAVGINLKDFWHDDGVFRVKYKDKFYEISADRAIELGKKYTLPFGSLPNLIPLSEFKMVRDDQLSLI